MANSFMHHLQIGDTNYELRDKGARDDIGDLRTAIDEIEPGLSDDAKAALLNCFQHVAWIDDHGQNYYDALETALYSSDYPRIVAVYEPGSHVVWDTDSLDSLKTYLTVTYYEDEDATGTTISANDYTLSGILSAGTSTITVTYTALTTKFTVSVSTHTLYSLPANTVFDGTANSPIITDVNLIDTNKTYSIVCTGSIIVTEGVTSTQTVMQVRDGNNGTGLVCGLYLTTKKFSIGSWGNSRSYDSSSDFSAGEHTFKVALSHTAGATEQYAAINFDNTVLEALSLNYNYVSGGHPLVIGSGYNANTTPYSTSQRMKGTLNELKVFDYAMSQSELNAYVA